MTADATRWLQCARPKVDPAWRLVCFPHAGGSASFYRDWGEQLRGAEVHAVCYPGRAERIDEPLPTDLRQMAGEIADAVEPRAGRDLALFGHSMGAPIALETARCLEARGVPLSHLFASGSRDAPVPPREPAAPDNDLEDGDVVIERLVRLGGTDAELANDPLFQELVLPYIIGDGRMFHAYVMSQQPLLRCPVTTVVGDVDHEADCRPWSELTTGPFREAAVRGDHFYP